MKNETGGQAFPRQDSRLDGNGLAVWQDEGMTLRDYFAAKAMQGMVSHPDTWGLRESDIALQAYAIADLMLSARE